MPRLILEEPRLLLVRIDGPSLCDTGGCTALVAPGRSTGRLSRPSLLLPSAMRSVRGDGTPSQSPSLSLPLLLLIVYMRSCRLPLLASSRGLSRRLRLLALALAAASLDEGGVPSSALLPEAAARAGLGLISETVTAAAGAFFEAG